jgi:hypothetical protein
MFLKTHFTNFISLDVSSVTSFPEFPDIHLKPFVDGSTKHEEEDG